MCTESRGCVSPGAPVSVHLTHFPEPDPALVQAGLEADVQAARRVLERRAGGPQRGPAEGAPAARPSAPGGASRRGARRSRVRAGHPRRAERRRLDSAEGLDDLLTLAVELDVRDASTLPPNAVPALRAALATRSGKEVRDELLASGRVTLPLGDAEVALGWADVKITVQGRDGFAAAVDRDVVVVLDTRITPALRRKAVARHLVHQIQMMRKEARLNVEDRIRVAVNPVGEAAEAIDEHRAYVCDETLAVELAAAPRPRAGSPERRIWKGRASASP